MAKQVIDGPEIRILGQIGRFEIVKKVVTTFIEFEKSRKGKGIEFRYQVEDLSKGRKLYIHRPGVKWNFDFKVEIPEDCGLEKGNHDKIALILRETKIKNEQEFNKFWKIITRLYHCSNNDVDALLRPHRRKIITRLYHYRNLISLNNPTPEVLLNVIKWLFIMKVEVLLKVIKWLFIMEDIIYWHYEGRAFLYNFFVYVVNEVDDNRLKNTISGIRERRIKPDKIKSLLKQMGIGWKLP